MKEAIQWAWWEEKDQEFRHVYRSEGIVRICSPDGFKTKEKRGEGKVCKVKITEVTNDKI